MPIMNLIEMYRNLEDLFRINEENIFIKLTEFFNLFMKEKESKRKNL